LHSNRTLSFWGVPAPKKPIPVLVAGLEWSQTFQPFAAGRFRSSTIPALQKPDKNSHDRIRIVGRGCTPGGLQISGLNSLKISEIVGCPNAELKKSNDLLTTTALSWSF
jgi:hypothetical protein